MSEFALSVSDLPLGTLAPEADYNQRLARAIELTKGGQRLSSIDVAELETARRELWSELTARKATGMTAYARFAAAQYGFSLDQEGTVSFPWKSADHRRVGYASDFYTSDPVTRSLAPVEIDHLLPRVIVFATGRAFAEKNARLGNLSTKEMLKNARSVMSAQVYLVGSRLVRGYRRDPVQVVSVAYDMVTSEEETPALRIQSILDPDFIHPVSKMATERIFGDMIALAEFNPNGTFARQDDQILGEALPDEVIIKNLSGLILVGGSVGCIVAHQVCRWLDQLMVELNVDAAVRAEARRSFLVINIGPTTALPVSDTNRISVINKTDEFVFAGNDIASIVEKSESNGTPFVPDMPSGSQSTSDGEAQSTSSCAYHVVLDVPATIFEGADGTVFDPIGTHFGHSLKHYTNGLSEIGLAQIVQRVLEHQGGFLLSDFVEEVTNA